MPTLAIADPCEVLNSSTSQSGWTDNDRLLPPKKHHLKTCGTMMFPTSPHLSPGTRSNSAPKTKKDIATFFNPFCRPAWPRRKDAGHLLRRDLPKDAAQEVAPRLGSAAADLAPRGATVSLRGQPLGAGERHGPNTGEKVFCGQNDAVLSEKKSLQCLCLCCLLLYLQSSDKICVLNLVCCVMCVFVKLV